MKLHLPPFPKLPGFKRGPVKPQQAQQAQRVLRASARSRALPPAAEDYDSEEEPTMRLSSAFVVVLLLHVVAVGGIYAFHSLKAQRRNQDVLAGVERRETTSRDEDLSASAEAPAAQDSTPAPTRVSNTQPVAASLVSGGRVHRVQAGDSIYKIADLYSVSTSDLAEINGLKENAILHPGQSLNIPKKTVAKAPATDTRKEFLAKRDEAPATKPKQPVTSGRTYTVVKGDNPVSIARKLGVSQDELAKLNKIDDPKKLKIGQVLKVPAK